MTARQWYANQLGIRSVETLQKENIIQRKGCASKVKYYLLLKFRGLLS
jgi:hypothetical protein